MPLIKGKSQKSFVKNLKTEMEAGKPQKQSLAIAYSMKRKAEKRKKMADGGDPAAEAEGSMPAVTSAPPKSSSGGGGGGILKLAALAAKGGEMKMLEGKEMYPHAKDKMFDVTNKYADGDEVQNTSQNPEDQEKAPTLVDPEKASQLAGSFKKAYAKGGFVAEEKNSGYGKMPQEHEMDNEPAHEEDNKELNEHPVDMNAETDIAEEDMVDRIMHKMSQNFSHLAKLSKGGMIANQEHGPNNNDLAGFSPNEFDDLVLRDDLESTYGDDDNAGDSLDNEQENEDRKDIVARIMASRRKKDRLPSPA